jgi:lipopolysaccharide export system permease protein
MFLLSKIIAKEWFKSLIGAVVVLFILITVGDIVNGFLRSYSAKRVFIEYILKMPDLMGKMLPISSLLATLFSINKLKSHAELIAILAGGYSALKVYLLVFICSLTIGLAQFINLGFLLPKANLIKRSQFEKSKANESKYLARSKLGGTGLLWYKSENYFSSFKAYDRVNKVLQFTKRNPLHTSKTLSGSLISFQYSNF